MPSWPLERPLWEAFAQRCAQGMPHGEAYIQARRDVGLITPIKRAGADVNAHRLFANKSVQKRYLELAPKAAAELLCFNRRWVLDELINTAVEAKKARNWSASTRALELLGRELGMFATVAKVQVKRGSVEDMSDEELYEIIRAGNAASEFDPDAPDDPSKLN
jgi:hypothetical protein